MISGWAVMLMLWAGMVLWLWLLLDSAPPDEEDQHDPRDTPGSWRR